MTLTDELGSGGEGSIYAIAENTHWVAKLYHPDKLKPEGVAKLRLSVSRPVPNNAIAAPFDLLIDASGRVLGFLMPRVPQGYPLHDLYTPRSRRHKLPFFTTTHLHRVARNLCVAVASLHHHGYVIGDVNESNVLVNPSALVFLIDTDSFQVRDPHQGIVYRCGVGKPEFTPPELQGKRFDASDRTPAHDAFGLAVLIFQLLMEGTHPFDGVYLQSGEPPLIQQRILQGYFPYGDRSVPVRPKPFAPPFEILHPKLQSLFRQCFEEGYQFPHRRPLPQQWAMALELAERELRRCSHNPRHRYGRHLERCPWCDRTQQLGGRDPFPAPNAVIPPLPKRRSPPKPKRPRPAEPQLRATAPRTFARPQQPFQRSARPWWVMLGGTVTTLSMLGLYAQLQVQGIRRETVRDIARLERSGQYEACLQNIAQASPRVRDRISEIGDRCRLGEAIRLARSGNFEGALAQLRRIPEDSPLALAAQFDRNLYAAALLKRAENIYEEGRVDLAVATLKAIPNNSESYLNAQKLIPQWTALWEDNRQRWQQAQDALNADRLSEALRLSESLTTPYWEEKGRQLRDEAYLAEFDRALYHFSKNVLWIEKAKEIVYVRSL